jgi:hypothetical protein
VSIIGKKICPSKHELLALTGPKAKKFTILLLFHTTRHQLPMAFKEEGENSFTAKPINWAPMKASLYQNEQ